VAPGNSLWDHFHEIFSFTNTEAFTLIFDVEFGFKIPNQEAIYLIARLTENENEIHLLWVAHCLCSLNYKVITDVIQNIFLTKYDGFCHFIWRERILVTQKYNNNCRVKLTSLTNQFINPLKTKPICFI
jgi:hypothetical protein